MFTRMKLTVPTAPQMNFNNKTTLLNRCNDNPFCLIFIFFLSFFSVWTRTYFLCCFLVLTGCWYCFLHVITCSLENNVQLQLYALYVLLLGFWACAPHVLHVAPMWVTTLGLNSLWTEYIPAWGLLKSHNGELQVSSFMLWRTLCRERLSVNRAPYCWLYCNKWCSTNLAFNMWLFLWRRHYLKFFIMFFICVIPCLIKVFTSFESFHVLLCYNIGSK